MRYVTIPEGWNPCKITVNNVTYEYPAGQTVEVPDEIAALIEQAAANQPQAKDQRQVFSIEFGPDDAGKAVAVNSDGTGVQLGGGYDLEIRFTATRDGYDESSGVIVSGSYEAAAKKVRNGLAPNIAIYTLDCTPLGKSIRKGTVGLCGLRSIIDGYEDLSIKWAIGSTHYTTVVNADGIVAEEAPNG